MESQFATIVEISERYSDNLIDSVMQKSRTYNVPQPKIMQFRKDA